jgi:hypothetical protein
MLLREEVCAALNARSPVCQRRGDALHSGEFAAGIDIDHLIVDARRDSWSALNEAKAPGIWS